MVVIVVERLLIKEIVIMSNLFSEWAGSVPTWRSDIFFFLLLTPGPASRVASVLAARTAALTSFRV
jgi:hypothetical protein